MQGTITIKKPFDAHVHVRRGGMLEAVTKYTAAQFDKAIVMPNTEPPIETLAQAIEYKKEILSAVPAGSDFEPLMTLYLTKNVTPEEIERASIESEGTKVYGVKYYPYGATTNSQWGYRSILDAKDVLKEMERVGLPLMLHGEVHLGEHDEEVDPYLGEKTFIEDVLPRLLDEYPQLKISLEHMSTKIASDFIEKNGKEGRLVATVTVQHLMYAREEIEKEPMLRCKPLIKSRADREAVRAIATKGLPFVSAGTDSAPHPEAKKLSPTGAFGVFSAPAAVELYAQVFDEMNALSNFEKFMSLNGPAFYGVEPGETTITLEKQDWTLNEKAQIEDGNTVVPLGFEETIHWKMKT